MLMISLLDDSKVKGRLFLNMFFMIFGTVLVKQMDDIDCTSYRESPALEACGSKNRRATCPL